LAQGGRLRRRFAWALGLQKIPLYSKPMNKQTAFNLSGVLQCLLCRFHGLRQQALCLFAIFFLLQWRSIFSWVALVVSLWHHVLSFRSNFAFNSDALKRAG
jgi:hypothetical protein